LHIPYAIKSVAAASPAAQCPEKLDAVHIGHDDVRDPERGLGLHHRQERLGSGASRGNHVIIRQSLRQVLAQRAFIIDEQDVRLGHACCRHAALGHIFSRLRRGLSPA
jgi:hypothetical protein